VSVDGPRREVYFVFRGINESHMDAIEAVLERHKLALVSQLADGASRLIGEIEEAERLAWETMARLGAAPAAEFATAAGMSQDVADRMLDTLWRRRLVIRYDGGYAAVGSRTFASLPSAPH
jgi:hypothetical protein